MIACLVGSSQEIATDSHSSVLLMHASLEVADEPLRKKLRVFLLLAPHLKGGGFHSLDRDIGI
jgi:hypothetical protein